jgi:hypothetical protein
MRIVFRPRLGPLVMVPSPRPPSWPTAIIVVILSVTFIACIGAHL